MSSTRHYTALGVAGALLVAAVLLAGCEMPPAPTEAGPSAPAPTPPAEVQR